MSARRLALKAHRWVSLAGAAFWLLQAATGVLITFHWEISDVLIAGPAVATDLRALDARLAALAPPDSGRDVTSVWATAGAADRYDILVEDGRSGASETVRVAGNGDVLSVRHDGERDWPDTLVAIHQTLLAGDVGAWIIGLSGLLLLSNLLFGLIIAWPRRGAWRRSLVPSGRGHLVRLYGRHRALGLWMAIPALILVASGTLLIFQDGIAAAIDAPKPAIGSHGSALPPLPFSTAVHAALSVVPGSRIAGIAMPTAEDRMFKVRLLAPGERRRVYGTTTVFVDSATGRVQALFPAAGASWPRAFMDMLYPLHTGELAGIVGRVFVTGLGLWLLTMIVLGLMLWRARAGPRSRS